MNNFLFVAAENDAIPNCKAGGMGDVVRDVPRHISKRGDKVQVVVPSYSRLHLNGTFITNLNFQLRGTTYKRMPQYSSLCHSPPGDSRRWYSPYLS